jgi:hypothetical protein
VKGFSGCSSSITEFLLKYSLVAVCATIYALQCLPSGSCE